jgi:CHAD domain-containing protein
MSCAWLGYAVVMSNTPTVERETERKYDVDDGVAVTDPAELLGRGASSSATEQRLEAVYFDTPDLALLRAGVTLRRREGGHDEGWHLKLPAGGKSTDSRDEVRLPLSGADRTPPPELVALTRLHARGHPLEPVAQLNTRRRRWVLSDDDGRELVELVEDEVHAHTLGRETTAMSWREVEVELGERGQRQLLDRIERSLLEAGARRSASSSKLRRLLADRLSAQDERRAGTAGRSVGPTRVDLPSGSAGEAVLAYLRAQADQLRRYDPLVRRDTPDAVHQMRVSARRMRAALRAYRRVIDDAATRDLVEELRWLGQQLADARDSEVIAERLSRAVESLPEELVLGPVTRQLTRTMQRRRADGREIALAALDSDRYLRLHDAVDQLLADPPLARRAYRSARRELATHVAREWRRTANRMARAQAGSDGEERDRALHEARKAAKRLRYAVEVAEPSGGKRATRLRRVLKKLASVLGTHQDAVVARPMIRELAGRAHLEGGNGFTHGLLYGQEITRAERARVELSRVWRRLTSGKHRKWLQT